MERAGLIEPECTEDIEGIGIEIGQSSSLGRHMRCAQASTSSGGIRGCVSKRTGRTGAWPRAGPVATRAVGRRGSRPDAGRYFLQGASRTAW